MLLTLILMTPTTPCAVVDPEYGAQYVTYVRRGEASPDYGYESRRRVWFRLRNNTTCPLRIPAAMPVKIRKLPDGSVTADPEDGTEVALDVWLSEDGAPISRVHPGGDVRSSGLLPGGRSVIFSVAANLLKRGPVAIDFAYLWERAGAPHRGVVQHRLVFDVATDFPYEPGLLDWVQEASDQSGASGNCHRPPAPAAAFAAGAGRSH